MSETYPILLNRLCRDCKLHKAVFNNNTLCGKCSGKKLAKEVLDEFRKELQQTEKEGVKHGRSFF